MSAIKVNSKRGMGMLADFARLHNCVLNEYHERLAKKYGVSLDGVVVSRQLPHG